MTIRLMMYGEIINRIAENMKTLSKQMTDLLKVKQLHTVSTVF
jgi:hypothetical protein